jgi:undecaprenyl-diphosphatase
MDPWLSTTIFGVVEGLSAFLPISSTGHLLLIDILVGHPADKSAPYYIIIDLGAFLAVAVMYRKRFASLVAPRPRQRFAGRRGLTLLLLTCLPASVLGIFTRTAIKDNLFEPLPVALALIAGACMMLIVEGRKKKAWEKYHDLDDISPSLALGIGLFQCLSLWPGFSRSAAIILGAMILGSRRRLAVEYSFISAVPLMIAASGYEMWKSWAEFNVADLHFLALGFVVAFFSAWLAVKWFLALIDGVTLRPFAVYRFALAGAMLLSVFWSR